MNRSEQHMPEPIRSPRRSNARRSTAFTLIELIVVMGVIGILALFTALGARRLSAGSRLAAATNAVTSALSTIRAAAIRDGVATGLVFRPVWDSSNPSKLQATELVAVRASGDVFTFGSINNQPSLALRWVPVRSVPSVRLAPGMKVAGPNYDPPPNSQFPLTNESSYSTQPEFRALANSCSESIEFNRTVAVLFGSNGEFLTRAPGASLAEAKIFVDWDERPPATGDDPQDVGQGSCASGNYERFWLQDHPNDECNLMLVPFLCVYDDRAARELRGGNWSDAQIMYEELTGPNGYIAQFGDRITFNRFSGIPERKVR